MDPTATTHNAWYRSTLATSLFGSILMWAAQPPLALGWLAWFAPVPWLYLVRCEEMPGRRHYRTLWLAGFVFWLLSVHWLRLPHPATSLGWLALAAYLAFYLPAFVALSRVAVHRLQAPLWLAAPVVWTGLELARAHLLTGFLMGSIAHTQVRWPVVIQISDLFGEYGVDFVIMLVAACITSSLFAPRRPAALAVAVLVLAATLGYGAFRLGNERPEKLAANSQQPGPRIALIQGNSLAEWKADPKRERQIMDEYLALSDRALKLAKERGDGRPLDLIVWPETMFRSSLRSFEEGYKLPPEAGHLTIEDIAGYGKQDLARLARRLNTAVLVGVDRAHFRAAEPGDSEPQPPLRYNSAVLVDREGNIVGTYDKIHRVMFGEYIPFAGWMPFLYRFTPLTGGIDAGGEPAVLELNGIVYSPNICYETVMPHVIRRHASLAGGSVSPDVLVNLTNDAWYWGSSELDMHLACGVFRAVETRKPLVIAANGGISAWIDHFGRIRAKSPRLETDVIIADVARSSMSSWYVRFGDWFAAVCLTCCVLLAVNGWRVRRLPGAAAPA